jgi:hypothetical protein
MGWLLLLATYSIHRVAKIGAPGHRVPTLATALGSILARAAGIIVGAAIPVYNPTLSGAGVQSAGLRPSDRIKDVNPSP